MIPIGWFSYAAESLTIDDLGFNSITDSQMFSSGFKIHFNNPVETRLRQDFLQVRTLMETDQFPMYLDYYSNGWNDLVYLASSYPYHSQDPSTFLGFSSFNDSIQAAGLVRWTSRNGFSLSLENHKYPSSTSVMDDSLSDIVRSSPSIIWSWQGHNGRGQYRVSALGRTLYVNGHYRNKYIHDQEASLGLNLEGGWRLGDLFAMLSVLVGEGINSLISGVAAVNDLTLYSGYPNSIKSFSIRPSLKYRFTDGSDFHVALGHYATEDSFRHGDIDTLDTVHIGYIWSPWPSTRFGVEILGQDIEGASEALEDSTQVKFGVQKHF